MFWNKKKQNDLCIGNSSTEFTIKITMQNRWIPYFLDMLRSMEYLGSIGSSRQLCFYADGDGDFRPKFEFDKKLIEKFVAPEIDEKTGCQYYDAG